MRVHLFKRGVKGLLSLLLFVEEKDKMKVVVEYKRGGGCYPTIYTSVCCLMSPLSGFATLHWELEALEISVSQGGGEGELGKYGRKQVGKAEEKEHYVGAEQLNGS